MIKANEEFKSPLELIEGQEKTRAQMEQNVNLIYAGLLIRNKKYDLAMNYFFNEIYQQKLEENRIWFFLHIELLTCMKDYQLGKDLALQRLQNFPKDADLYLLLQYVIWKELSELEDKKINQVPAPENVQELHSGNLMDLRQFKELLEKKLEPAKHNLDVRFWDGEQGSNPDLTGTGSGTWNLKDYTTLVNNLRDALTGSQMGSLETVLLEYPDYSLQSHHRESENLLIHHKKKSALCYYIESLGEPDKNSPAGDSGSDPERPHRELSSLYTASLLESREFRDCLSYLSLQRGIEATVLTDAMGYPLAVGEGTPKEMLETCLRKIKVFQEAGLDNSPEKPLEKQINFSGKNFFQIESLEGNYLIILGQREVYESIRQRIDHCMNRVKMILEAGHQGGDVQRLLQLEPVRGTTSINWKEDLKKITWKGKGRIDFKVEKLSGCLCDLLKNAENGEFQQFILGTKNGIILGQRSGVKLFMVLVDRNSELGLVKWELNNIIIQE